MVVKNTGFFKGKTALISGASRGIGLAIAKKLARDGANIVIAAKTTEPHPKLPGTIYTAAKEIEDAGGQCLPCIVDVRDEESIKRAVQQTIERFGGIDILVNNASCISLTPTEQTDAKKFDLMHSINIRGTFLLSKHCIPHLRGGRNPHIMNISPPLDMNPIWFAPHVAYTMSKFGMSMCVLGMSQELENDGIAVNALWPRTIVLTAAVANITNKNDDTIKNHSRKPEIMADAAYLALSQPSTKFTGNFLIDDTFLAEVGGLQAKDFDAYACNPSETLQPDFFVPDHYKDPMEGPKRKWESRSKL